MAYDDKYKNIGHSGSAYFTTQNAVRYSSEIVYIAIYFVTESVFEVGVTGLVPETTYKYLSSNAASSAIGANSLSVDGITWAAGETIYGRWTGFELASGSCIAYIE